ncbi:hypothetical protein ACFYZ9_33670 [Streptomyces sp. NPDC001691]|uniref:hypothetical protein n=1 Tax=Streptomyces sp. NPDC001691 TaxID=3364600 RepID=UPI00369C173D
MSVSLGKSTDQPQPTTEQHPDTLYISVVADPDGTVTGVSVTDTEPDAMETFLTHGPHTTVWQAPEPEFEDDPSHAVKVLDVAINNRYRHEDGHAWSEGERKANEFHRPGNADRATLRTIEAHLILSGMADVHTGVTDCQGYGLTIIEGERYYLIRDKQGWKLALHDWVSYEGWSVDDNIVAPLDAKPATVAAAVMGRLREYNGIEVRIPLWRRALDLVRRSR